MLTLECQLIDLFHWSLRDLDETDIESLIPFFLRYPRWKQGTGAADGPTRIFADEADWL